MSSRIKMSFSNHVLILFLICFFGLLFRLLGLVNITLAGDFVHHWQVAGNIITKGTLPLLGPTASENNNFHLGPFYYYFLAIPYLLGHGHYQVAIIFFSLFNTLSIVVLYLVCKQWFSIPESLKITALYAFSYFMITIQNFPWNPYIIPFFSILSLYCLTQIQKKRYFFTPLLFLCFSILLQGHATALFLFPVFFLLLPVKQIPLRFYGMGMVLLVLSLAPWIYSDVTTNFSQSKAAVAILLPGPQESFSVLQYLSHHGHGERCFSQIRNTLFIGRLFTMSLFTTENLGVVLLILGILVFTFLRISVPQKKLLLLWIVVPWICFLFYASNVYLHYFLILIPIPFILTILLLEKLHTFGKWGTVLSNGVFSILILLNVIQYLLSLHALRG